MSIEDNKEFIIEEGMVMEYVGNGKEVEIPAGVTDIFFEAFYGVCAITSVTIPGTILDITPFVFERCSSLKKVSLKEGVKTIGVNSFNDCEKLEIINLPKSIECIKIGAFSNCPLLKEIRFNGTKKEWDTVTKEEKWDENTGEYAIICCSN